MCGAQGIDFRAPLTPGRGVRTAHERVRAIVPRLERDRVLSGDISALMNAVSDSKRCRRHRKPRMTDLRVKFDPNAFRVEETRGPIRAPRGTAISCKGWQQEAALRMLMNNLDPDVAERPDDLVVYGGTGRAARSWEAFDAIVGALRALENDETLLVQSGKPVAVFRTHASRAARAHREQQPRRPLGDLGAFPRARAAGPDDVRPDDRRLVDLHRLAGHRAGHVRDVRRGRATALRRLARRPVRRSPRDSAAWAARSRSPRR